MARYRNSIQNDKTCKRQTQTAHLFIFFHNVSCRWYVWCWMSNVKYMQNGDFTTGKLSVETSKGWIWSWRLFSLLDFSWKNNERINYRRRRLFNRKKKSFSIRSAKFEKKKQIQRKLWWRKHVIAFSCCLEWISFLTWYIFHYPRYRRSWPVKWMSPRLMLRNAVTRSWDDSAVVLRIPGCPSMNGDFCCGLRRWVKITMMLRVR